jgi:hypothetical protein
LLSFADNRDGSAFPVAIHTRPQVPRRTTLTSFSRMPHLTRDFAKLVKLVRRFGLRRAIGVAGLSVRARCMRQVDRAWEESRGLSFDDTDISLDSLSIQSPNKQHGFSYVPCTGVAVRTLLGNLNADFRRFCFVDFGSGEGRSLVFASTFSFDEVIGVEFAEELHHTAQRNLQKMNPDAFAAGKMRSVHMDAQRFEIPRRDSVLYFYNPFGEAVFGHILQNIERVYHECHPKFYIIFHQTRSSLETDDTRNAQLLKEASFLNPIKVRFPNWRSRFLLGSQDLYIFESKDSVQVGPPDANRSEISESDELAIVG